MAKCPKCGKYWDCGELDEGEGGKCSIKDCAKCWCLDCKGYTPEIRKRYEIVQLKYLIAEEQYRAIDKSLKPDTVQTCHDLIEAYKDKLRELGVKNV